MKKIIILIGIMASMVLLSGCNSKQKDAIIKINDTVITKSQYEQAFDKNVQNSPLSQIGIDFRKDPDSYFYLVTKQKVLNEMIYKTLIDQEVAKRKIKVSNDELEAKYATVLEQVGGREKFNELLKQNQVSQATFKNDLKEQLMLEKLVNTLGVVSVFDADVEAYYKKNIKDFNFPEKVKSSHIMIIADPVQIKDVLLQKEENKKLSKEELDKKIEQEIDAKEKKAKEILAKVKQDPTQFAKYAKENSDDVYTAQYGGDMGFMAREELPKEYADVAFAQKPNTISEIVVTPYGFHIIMVTDRIKAGTEPFEKVKFELKNYLENQEKIKLFQKFLENIKNNAKIEYIDKDYDIAEIEKKLVEIQKKTPSLMDAVTATE